jgi:hypothetical protein
MLAKVAAEQIVAGEPRLRVLHQVFVLSGCRDSRGHLNSDVIRLFTNPDETQPHRPVRLRGLRCHARLRERATGRDKLVCEFPGRFV